MNTPQKTLRDWAAILLLSGALVAHAQQTPVAQGSVGASPGERISLKDKALGESLSYFESQSFVAGEQVLEQANEYSPGTPSWHTESAYELIRVVSAFHNSGHVELAAQIAQLAIGHLTTADRGYTKSDNPAEVASEKTLLADLYRDYLGDRVTAESLYSEALQLVPNLEPTASILERLKREDAVIARRMAAAATGN